MGFRLWPTRSYRGRAEEMKLDILVTELEAC